MADLLKILLDILTAASPLRIVWAWEVGLFYFCGRYNRTLSPGLKFIIPGLMDIRRVSVVPEISTTPLQTVTLRNGKALTYSASITTVVRDASLAYNTLGHYAETVVELAARMLSDGLADADPESFGPVVGSRCKLLEAQRVTINKVCMAYGIEITQLGINNFVIGVKTIRLLLDKAVLGPEHAKQPSLI